MRIMWIVFLAGCWYGLVSAFPNADAEDRAAVKDKVKRHELDSEILFSTLRVTPSWSTDFVNLAEVGDTISVNGNIQLQDRAKLRLRIGVCSFIKTSPEGIDVIHNETVIKFEQKQPGEYVFAGNLRGPLKPGIYRVDIQSDGKVIMQGRLEVW